MGDHTGWPGTKSRDTDLSARAGGASKEKAPLDDEASQNGQGDARFMHRAIALAQRAEGYTSPNPMVGCVLVKGDSARGFRIVGEGFHAGPGAPHAEVMAVRAAGADARGAVAYVTLEPCNHHGRTPPCSEALIAAGVSRVLFAVRDPNPVAAGGAARLAGAGIKVAGGLCADEAGTLLRHWLCAMREKRPYVTAKFAASLDGCTATRTGDSKWITNKAARLRGHDLRQASDAIIVGVETVIKDDPALTARPAASARRQPAHPLRVVLDSKGRTPMTAQVLRATTAGSAVIATTTAMPRSAVSRYEGKGAQVWVLPQASDGRPCLEALMGRLYQHAIHSVMVEGGSTTLGSFMAAGLVDELWAFIAPIVIGGGGRPAIGGNGATTLAGALCLDAPVIEHFDDNFLVRGKIRPRGKAQPQSKALSGEAACLPA